jgi:hypothetical protein
MNPDCSTVRAWRMEQWRLAPWNPGGWIGKMTNDDHVEGMVAQTRDDVSVMTRQWATCVVWSVCARRPCAQSYRF